MNISWFDSDNIESSLDYNGPLNKKIYILLNNTILSVKMWWKCRKNKIEIHSNVFKYIGTHWSLSGKIQTLVDKKFKEKLKYENHTNPKASLEGSLVEFDGNSLRKCYNGEHFYWAKPTESNQSDFINFNLKHLFFLKCNFINMN